MTTDAFPAGGLPGIPPMAGLSPQEDYIDGPSSTRLYGTVLEYRYTINNHYRLTFDHQGKVTFDLLNHADGPAPPLLPYRARELREDMVLVHWLVKPVGIHVALVIDFGRKTVSAAAMMPPNRWEFFDIAELLSVESSNVESSTVESRG